LKGIEGTFIYAFRKNACKLKKKGKELSSPNGRVRLVRVRTTTGMGL